MQRIGCRPKLRLQAGCALAGHSAGMVSCYGPEAPTSLAEEVRAGCWEIALVQILEGRKAKLETPRVNLSQGEEGKLRSCVDGESEGLCGRCLPLCDRR